MANTGFLGAKASNAGDSFHELWALHATLELLNPKTALTALTIEGVRVVDNLATETDPWSGVDCASTSEDIHSVRAGSTSVLECNTRKNGPLRV